MKSEKYPPLPLKRDGVRWLTNLITEVVKRSETLFSGSETKNVF
jgi:hypothetical protein